MVGVASDTGQPRRVVSAALLAAVLASGGCGGRASSDADDDGRGEAGASKRGGAARTDDWEKPAGAAPPTGGAVTSGGAVATGGASEGGAVGGQGGAAAHEALRGHCLLTIASRPGMSGCVPSVLGADLPFEKAAPSGRTGPPSRLAWRARTASVGGWPRRQTGRPSSPAAGDERRFLGPEGTSGERRPGGGVGPYCLHFAACGDRSVRPPLRFALPSTMRPASRRPAPVPDPLRLHQGHRGPSGASHLEKTA